MTYRRGEGKKEGREKANGRQEVQKMGRNGDGRRSVMEKERMVEGRG